MTSQKRRSVIDRGTAAYFHGRKEEIDFFNDSLKESKERGEAKSILIQGPPGVGKTALIEELKKKTPNDWRIVDLQTITRLGHPIQLGRLLLGRKKFQQTAREVGLDLKLLQGKITQEKAEETALEILSLVKQPTLLILDEAQIAEIEFKEDASLRIQAPATLNAIHNLKNNHGLVMLFAGLGNTRKVFQNFKISRFYGDSMIDLQPIDQVSERAILRDYMVKGASLDAQHPDLNHWLDELSKETFQWPHHVASYGDVASKMIQENDGILSNGLLKQVMEKGLLLKNQYYQHRFYEISAETRCHIYQSFFENEINTSLLNKDGILRDFKLNPYIEEPQKTWDDLVGRGVVQWRDDGFYSIPIPSMRTWMLDQFQTYCQLISHEPSIKIQQLFETLKASKGKIIDTDRKPTD